jgi:RING-variant domain
MNNKKVHIEENTDKVCRICFEHELDEKKLISPCLCKGYSKYIHEECLNIWLLYQDASKSNINCEVCKYSYNIEEVVSKKCDPSHGIYENPNSICYLGILIIVKVIIISLIYIVIAKDYINPYENIVYFIGILSIFLFSLICSTTVVFKLLKQICYIDTSSKYKILPYIPNEDNLNSTNLFHTIGRIESIGQFEGPLSSQEVYESSQNLIRVK